ncbi:MAG: hypothetical protein IJ562_05885 [Prevotella sp.]|nr:hypothetical protein [Prevotella sp.]
MAVKRFQNKVAEGRYVLPIVAAYALGIWYLGGLVGQKLYVQLAFTVLSTYLMVELNNSNALIRVYSRMVSCSFLALTCITSFLFPSLRIALLTLCLITFYTIIFHTYQDKQSPGLTFYAFLCIGLASLAFVQVLFFVPFLWLIMAFYLMAFSHKMFWASIIGITTPYWFLLPFSLITDNIDLLAGHFVQIAQFEPLFQYQQLNGNHVISLLFIIMLYAIGSIHYMRRSYLDKIRTRMLHFTFIAVGALTLLFIILQPQHMEPLLAILIINTSPLIAHFIALTHTRVTNIVFCVLIISALILTAVNLWIPLSLS